MASGPVVQREQVVQGGGSAQAARQRIHRAGVDRMDVGEADPAVQEGRHGLLVGRVQDGRTALGPTERVVGQEEPREALTVGFVAVC